MSDTKFNIGDYVVCPGHGVGQIIAIDSRQLSGETQSMYIVKVISNGLKVMVRTDSEDGVRSLVTDSEVQEVFNLLSTHNVEVSTATWNRRHREYMTKINTGSLLEIADVLRALFLLKNSKTLSYGERQLLGQCKGLITKEIALSQGNSETEVGQKIDSYFS
jgi:CarD family transcriptional regulator